MSRGIVYKGDVPAATLETEPDGVTAFQYLPAYLESASLPIATSLPLTDRVHVERAGAIPPFFAGLLPEGRRLTGLRRGLKISADDELGLILAIGNDLVGDVRVIEDGSSPVEPSVLAEIGSENTIFSELLAEAGIVDPVGIAGVQDKVSARMMTLPAKRAGERFILKLSPPEYPHVVENEAFFLAFARELRIPAAKSEVIYDRAGTAGLLVQRFDRVDGTRRAMEDACQVLGRWPANKYDTTSEQSVNALAAACAAPAVAARLYFRQLLFAWLTGNGDVHAKNLSILGTQTGEWVASPAYDLPSTVLYGDKTMALDINGEDSDITSSDFLAFAAAIDLPLKAAQRSIQDVLNGTEGLRTRFESSNLPFELHLVDDLFEELTRRRGLLGG